MKLLSLTALLLLSTFTAFAQNWQAVYSDRVQYFNSGLNAIKIVSASVNNDGDSTFKNYTSVFLNKYNMYARHQWEVTDSSSWIGKRLIIKPNGINEFIHTFNDTCFLYTHASDKDVWNFIGTNTITIEAKVDSIGFNTHKDITDSVKYITLKILKRPLNNAEFYEWLNNKQIWLSKHNGLLRFPLMEYNLSASTYVGVETEYFQTRHNQFTNKNMFDFAVGDVIHRKVYSNFLFSSLPNWSEQIFADKYLEKIYDPVGDSVQYKIQTRFYHKINPAGTVLKDSTYIRYTTYYNLSQQAFGIMPLSVSGYMKPQYYSQAGWCENTFYFQHQNGCPRATIYQSGVFEFEQHTNMGYTEKEGGYYKYVDGSSGNLPSSPYTIVENILFIKNGCWEYGVNTLGIDNQNIKKQTLTIYPNPAKSLVTINGENIESVEITDIQGRVVNIPQFKLTPNEIQLSTNELLNAVYFVKTKQNGILTISKLIIHH